jgi:hypothetical protein
MSMSLCTLGLFSRAFSAALESAVNVEYFSFVKDTVDAALYRVGSEWLESSKAFPILALKFWLITLDIVLCLSFAS